MGPRVVVVVVVIPNDLPASHTNNALSPSDVVLYRPVPLQFISAQFHAATINVFANCGCATMNRKDNASAFYFFSFYFPTSSG